MPSIGTRQPAPTPVTDNVPLPPRLLPDLPADVLERFPSLVEWNENSRRGWTRAYQALQNSNRDVSQNITSTQETARTFRSAYNQFVAEVTEEIETITNEQGAQARRIVTVSAMAGISTAIKVQTTPPAGPALNDYWINNSDALNPVTYKWNGSDWEEVTTPISFAGVADERTARVTADGFLEGKYTLTVVAGDVITGFNITSASGPGTSVSNVAWSADQFLIQGSTTKKQMFYSDAGQDVVRLADLFTVDGANDAIYAKTTPGVGVFNSAGTPIYFDIAGGVGRMSLGTRLVWDGSTLNIGNSYIGSNGEIVLGTSNDVIILTAADPTYRVWAGNAAAGSANFSVTKTGLLFANNAQIAGTFVASDDPAFPTWQGGTLATRGVFNQRSGGTAPAYASLGFNTSSLIEGNVANGAYGALTAVTTTGVGLLLNTKFYNGAGWVSGSNIEIRNDASVSGAAAASSYVQIQTNNTAGQTSAWRWGSNGQLSIGPNILSLDTTLYRSSANTLATGGNFVAGGGIAVGGGSSNPLIASSGRLYFAAGGSNRFYISDSSGNFVLATGSSGQIVRETSTGQTVGLSDGTYGITFSSNGTQIFGHINGGAAILLG